MNHSIRGRWLLPVLAVAALIALSPATAEAQASTSGATDVTVNLPDIVVLHYFSTVDVSIDSAALTAFLGFGGGAVDEGGGTSATDDFTQNLAISPTDPTGTTTAAQLTLSNAWAVRSIGNAGAQTQISIASDATLDRVGGGSIAITPGVRTGTNTFATSEDFDPPGLASPQVGDVQLTLDMTNAVQSGDYVGTYTLTVQNL